MAGARGFPDGDQYEEQLAALAVHHAHHVQGYRRVHRVARVRVNGVGTHDASATGTSGALGTEEMRAAMVDARALFDDLVGGASHDAGRRRTQERVSQNGSRSGHHLPRGFHRHQAKEG